MSILVLIFIIIILSVILLKLLHIQGKYIICLFLSIFIFLFIKNITVSMNSIISGCKLCFYSIFPTIFPFSVICNLLIAYDGINIYSKVISPLICKPLKLSTPSSFAIAASFICGYPFGAKYSSNLYELGYINKKEYLRLINIATNCGPLFIIGAVASGLLKNSHYGYLLLIANYLSVILIGLFTMKNHSELQTSTITPKDTNNNFGENFKNAVTNALSTVMTVCGFIILFSCIIGIIKNNAYISIILSKLEDILSLPDNILSSFFYGSIEITNGCAIVSNSNISIHLKLAIISFLCSFSGLSIIFQSYSFLSKHNVSLSKYTLSKFLQGIFSFIITYFISIIFNKDISTSSIFTYSTPTLIYITLLLLLIIPYILFSFKKLLIHNS